MSIEVSVNKRLTDISDIISGCIEKSYPFALWRKPNQSETFFLFSKTRTPVYKQIDFQELDSGFVMAPFSKSGAGPLFIEGDFISRLDGSDIVENWDTVPDDLKDHLQQAGHSSETHLLLELSLETLENEKKVYQEKVSAAISAIQNAGVEKVVLSRKKHVGKISGNGFFEAFEKLDKAYPSAFISMTWLPWLNQLWLGATPETLVEQTPDGFFKTMALAGTQYAFDKDGQEIKPIDALWTQKEIEEQALVSRYIINCLKKIRVREFKEEGPRTLKAGNLLHLSTLYSIDTKEISFPQLSSVMLELLHPTSAVCGMPKEASLDFIESHENYDREFYSGFLGPINIEGSSHLFVNLRTMKIEAGEVYCYAGGGITTHSDPEKEWKETELKLQTILKSFD
ncbi:isochorismate synthase [Emticicia sp. CRIBPO]|uniref:chorismate-binding protein n=1 Tax=Emticicia sp. CRIBPO TaxID=2683258 RepID=UPI001412F18F|nr:chorismate-binding protein [Emticicia sp. CRIBPO]NBA88759.1 isochorismate synthase [Emticicia sp. CRIBPO]